MTNAPETLPSPVFNRIIAEDTVAIVTEMAAVLSPLESSTLLVTGGGGFLCSYFLDVIAALNDLAVVRAGTCAAPQAAVGPPSAFPALGVTGEGIGEAAAVIQRRLTGMEYAVQIVENGDGSGAVLACADLARSS
jgi:hypothetical protein